MPFRRGDPILGLRPPSPPRDSRPPRAGCTAARASRTARPRRSSDVLREEAVRARVNASTATVRRSLTRSDVGQRILERSQQRLRARFRRLRPQILLERVQHLGVVGEIVEALAQPHPPAIRSQGRSAARRHGAAARPGRAASSTTYVPWRAPLIGISSPARILLPV